MSNTLTDEFKAQIFGQNSNDPFLTLVTLSSPAFVARLVNNSRDITSRGHGYTAFPMKITLPIDDGQTARSFNIDFDNASLLLITSLRSVTGNISVTIEMVLASMPDVVQFSFQDLVVSSVNYNASKISATIIMDNFLSVEMSSERYTPSGYPGLF